VYKKGKFSAIEAQQIAGAIEEYKEVSSRPFASVGAVDAYLL
jgi:hypothetical protein